MHKESPVYWVQSQAIISIGGWYWKMCQYMLCQCKKKYSYQSICLLQIKELKECRLFNSHWVLPRSSALIELTLGCIHIHAIIMIIHTLTAASEKGNTMLTHYHPGVYGSSLKNQWSCCKNSERTCQGCHSIHQSICMCFSNVLSMK